MRRICTFVPAATVTGAPRLGTTARTPATTRRHAVRFAGAAAPSTQLVLGAVAEPASRQVDSPPDPRA